MPPKGYSILKQIGSCEYMLWLQQHTPLMIMSTIVLVESTLCQMAPKKMYLVQLCTILIICLEDTGIYLLLPPIHSPYQSCCFFCVNSATFSVVQICKLGEPAGWSFVTAVKKSQCKPWGMNGTRTVCSSLQVLKLHILSHSVSNSVLTRIYWPKGTNNISWPHPSSWM